MEFTSSRIKHGRNVFYNSKKRRCTTVKSHANSSESNNSNASKSDNVIVNSNLLHINVHTKSSISNLIIFQKETDTESSISINDEIMEENNISGEI